MHTTFISLVKEHERIIFKVCYLYADNDADRQDLYQEIVIQVWKGYQKFRGDSKFSTWLYQVAINTAMTGFRKEKRSPLTRGPDGKVPDVADVNFGEQETEQLEQLYSAINQLNDIEKALVMLYLDGKSYEEMENIMGITNGALRVKMTRIKEKLRQLTKSK
ncbi:sigma-70 family RNA polymerase sigma factor [Mucilaginibacter sp. BJC16-A38]|nr:sigma-70 family RNA polymerase sigma factor [Mucilaginibacter phenanthrenivorans]